MNLLQARQLARSLMADHGLADWRFMFDRAKRRFGCCHYRRKLITLSQPLTLLNSEHQVRDTLLHEIAHALAPGAGHGPRWRMRCLQIGAQPRSCYRDSAVASPPRPAAKYLLGCPTCNWWAPRHRRPSRRYICTKCNSPISCRLSDCLKDTGSITH